MLRHTLNGLTARTVRDTERDPYDWGDSVVVRSHIRGAGGAMRKIAGRPSVIRCRPSLFTRAVRWVKAALLRLGSPR
jgi:hypothetical protein